MASAQDGYTELMAAVDGCQVETCAALLRDGNSPDLQMSDGTGRTALWQAAYEGYTEIIKLLLQYGASVDLAHDSGATPLYVASVKGHTAVCDILLENGAAVNSSRRDGFSPLMVAADHGHIEICATLLCRGALPNLQETNGGSTALWKAAFQGHEEVVTLLLENGASVNIATIDGWTPLHAAAKNGHADICEALLQHSSALEARTVLLGPTEGGPKIKVVLVQTEVGLTALDLATHGNHNKVCWVLQAQWQRTTTILNSRLVSATRLGNTHVVRELLDKGAAVNSAFQDAPACNYTALMAAVDGCHIEICETLLRNGASPDLQMSDGTGRTALWKAAYEGHIELVKLLLKYGASVDLAHENGATPLSVASHRGHTAVCDLLLVSGAAVNSCMKDGFSPLMLAADRGHIEICAALLDRGALPNLQENSCGSTALWKAAFQGHRMVVAHLLQHGGLVDIATSDGWTPLHIAAKNGHADICEALLQHGSAIKARTVDGSTALDLAVHEDHNDVCRVLIREEAPSSASKQTALHIAAERGLAKVCLQFLESGISVFARDTAGLTALHLAIHRKHTDVCLVLVNEEARYNPVGQTALHIAAEKGIDEVCIQLLESGAIVSAQDKDGKTALDYAIQEKRDKTCSVLVKEEACHNLAGEAALHIASKRGLENVCRELLQLGAPLVTVDNRGLTPLDLAILHKHYNVCSLLVEEEARRDSTEKTALHVASERGLEEVCQQLLDSGAPLHAVDAAGKTALHLAAERGHVRVCCQLVKNGAEIHVKDNDGATPIQIAERSGRKRLLRELQTLKLFHIGSMMPTSALLRVGGPPGSGKSTFTDSLCTSRVAGFFRREDQSDEGDKNLKERTKGLRCKIAKKRKSFAEFMIMDLGGQGEFFASHQALISSEETPVINAILLSALTEKEEMRKEANKWAAFFACKVRPVPVRQPLVLILSRGDKAMDQDKQNVEEVFSDLCKDFDDHFYFPYSPCFVDSRKSWSPSMEQLRSDLHELQKKVLKEAAKQPAVCQLIEDVLPLMKYLTDEPIVTKKQFIDLMVEVLRRKSKLRRKYSEDIVKASVSDEVITPALRYLTRLGKVVSFTKPSLAGHVIIKPNWIYTDLVGLLLSGQQLPPPRVRYDNGYAKISDVINILDKASVKRIDGKFATDMLAELGFIIILPNGEDVMVPIKLTVLQRPSNLWPAIRKLFHCGRRMVCHGAAGISHAFFPQLQCCLYHLFLEKYSCKLPLWKGGICITSEEHGAQAIVEARPELKCVDVIVRGEEEFRDDCQRLLQKLMEIVIELADDISPGSRLERQYLSSRELAHLSSSGSAVAPNIVYTQQRVEMAAKMSRTVTDGRGSPPEKLEDLLLSHEELIAAGEGVSEPTYSYSLPHISLSSSEQETMEHFLHDNWAKFRQHLQTGELIGPLFSAKVIEWDERDSLLSRKRVGRANHELTELLLEHIDKKEPEQKFHFLHIVRAQQADLVSEFFSHLEL